MNCSPLWKHVPGFCDTTEQIIYTHGFLIQCPLVHKRSAVRVLAIRAPCGNYLAIRELADFIAVESTITGVHPRTPARDTKVSSLPSAAEL